MPNFAKLPTWADKKHIHAVVETPRGSHCKLEFDPKHRAFTLAKPLLAGLTYPYDWGLILSTQAEDGDPLDVLVIHDAATYPGLLLRCKPIGVLEVLQTSKDGRKGTTEFSRCLTGHHLRESCRTSGVFQHAQLRSWRNFLKLPMRLKIKTGFFGLARSKASDQNDRTTFALEISSTYLRPSPGAAIVPRKSNGFNLPPIKELACGKPSAKSLRAVNSDQIIRRRNVAGQRSDRDG
jgi:inorganic pyrophosphatase